MTSKSDQDFNCWTGFQAKRVTKPASEALELMKRFLFETWASSDETAYAYIVSWFAGLVTNLTGINRVALVMVSLQGAGKGTFLEFMALVLRATNMCSLSGIESVTRKFNKILQGKRLINVNELSTRSNRTLQTPRLQLNQKESIPMRSITSVITYFLRSTVMLL